MYLIIDLCHHFDRDFFFNFTDPLILVVLGSHKIKLIQFNVFDAFVRKPVTEFLNN